MENEIERLLRELGIAVNSLPQSREKSLVLTKLDEAELWYERLRKNAAPALDWSAAEAHLIATIEIYNGLHNPPQSNCTPALEMVLNPLLMRFKSGERTSELYQQMMNVE